MSESNIGTTAKYSRPDPTAKQDWEPGDGNPARHCLSCGGVISTKFARVFGNNKGEVWACPECSNGTKIRATAVSDRSYEHRVQKGDADE